MQKDKKRKYIFYFSQGNFRAVIHLIRYSHVVRDKERERENTEVSFPVFFMPVPPQTEKKPGTG